jgi:subtilisin family serine protease
MAKRIILPEVGPGGSATAPRGTKSVSRPPAEPPIIKEHHVRLPHQLNQILRADTAHNDGTTGKGIRVAIIDSGFYLHPYFEKNEYMIRHVPTRKEPDPHIDDYGHGTAQLASLLSIAPQAEILAIKCMDRDPSYSLRKAIALRPDILICAWGFDVDHPGTKKLPEEYNRIHRMLVNAHKIGICIVAAAGNGQYAFPGNMREVISAGGVFYTPDGQFAPSDLASSFASSIFPGRMVPDVCGLVGNMPFGRLLLVPVPPKAKLAKRPAFSMIAAGEQTDTVASGWAMFSGTSAAASMIAGAAALLLQKNPSLSPDEVKRLLIESAVEVGSDDSTEPKTRVLNVQGALEKCQYPLFADLE